MGECPSGMRRGAQLHNHLPSNLLLVGLALVLIVAAGLRFYNLDGTSIWYDEAVSWEQASRPFFRMIAATSHDNYPPLHNIILNVTITFFGDSETALRAPSALLGVANVYLLYELGAVLWDRTTGLFAALLLALSGFHIGYSSEARMYTLLAFTATLFVLTVVRALRSPNWGILGASAAAGTALLYSHVYGSFVFVGVNLFILMAFIARAGWLAVGWRSWLATQAIAAIVFLPWLVVWDAAPAAMHGIARGVDWIPKPTSQFLLQTLESVAGSPRLLLILVGLAALPFIDFAAIRSFSSEALTGRPIRTKTQHWLRLEWQNGIILVWLIAPLLAGYLISLSIHPMLLPRYLICSLPAFLLLAAAGLTSITRTSRHSKFAMGVALLVIVAIHIPEYSNLTPWRDDHRTAAQEFSLRYRPSDRVIFLGTYGPFQYYYRKPIFDARFFSIPSQITYDDMNANRFWLSYYLSWSSFNKQYDISSLLARAKRDHDVIYSFRSPGEGGLEMLLFQRRTVVR